MSKQCPGRTRNATACTRQIADSSTWCGLCLGPHDTGNGAARANAIDELDEDDGERYCGECGESFNVDGGGVDFDADLAAPLCVRCEGASVAYPNGRCSACGFGLPNHADDCPRSATGWDAWGISLDDRERWEEYGYTDATDVYERTHLPYGPAEWRRMEDGGLSYTDVAVFTDAGVSRPEAMLAWRAAGWSSNEAARMVRDEGFPGPNGVDFANRPRPVSYETLSALRAGSMSEAQHRRGDPYPEISPTGGTTATRGRTWDGTPVVAEAVYNPNAITGFAIVGASAELERTVRDRVRAAILNSNMAWPGGRVTINVTGAPLDSRCDAAIATSILAATAQIHPLDPSSEMWGELSLDGRIVDTNMNR